MEELDRRLLLGAAGLAGVAALAGRARGGPLTPPVGAVASSGKTLTEVEPRIAISAANTPGDASSVFVISQPGGYYLTGNVTVPANKQGILITASDVTVDLNGFTLSGGGAASTTGIRGQFPCPRARVHGGRVTGMTAFGIILNTSEHCRVEDMSLDNNPGMGVEISNGWIVRVVARGNAANGGFSQAIKTGYDAFVIDCMSVFNSGAGVSVGQFCVVQGCTTQNNTSHGIYSGGNTLISGCVSRQNALDGIYTEVGSTVEGCTAWGNNWSGISVSRGCVVRACTTQVNGLPGIKGAEGCVVTDCTSSGNASGIPGTPVDGIQVAAGSTVSGCTVFDNTGNGITTVLGPQGAGQPGAVIDRCVARRNTLQGINAGPNCTVTNCQATNNSLNGVLAGSGCMLSGNHASYNTGLGISTGAGCTLTGNHASNNTGQGISAGAGCLVLNNTAAFNTGLGLGVAGTSTVSGNQVNNNSNHGMIVGGGCTVANNHIASNIGSGLQITGVDCRVEGNDVTGHGGGFGILVQNGVPGCLLVRNSCSGNATNFQIAAGSTYGVVVNGVGGGGAMAGNAAPSTLVSTDPHLNVAY